MYAHVMNGNCLKEMHKLKRFTAEFTPGWTFILRYDHDHETRNSMPRVPVKNLPTTVATSPMQQAPRKPAACWQLFINPCLSITL